MGEQLAVSRGIPSTGQIHPMPFTRIELAVLSIVDGGLAVLLGKRAGAPHKGKWALPGGVIRIDLDEDLEAAVQRVARERLEVELPFLRQLCAVGGASRDPRSKWGLSIVYRGLLPSDAFDPKAGKRIDVLAWRPVDEVMLDTKLAFDHGRLVARAVEATRADVDRLELPFGFLPEQFTLGELQATCEQIVGRRLDKSSFRRKLDERKLIRPVEGEMRTGAFRPAQLYRERVGN
jgi:ADP-ribose pyrophosphatase YjhB (NUDIX family)